MAVDLINASQGVVKGEVATTLMNNGFNINALRTNSLLLYDEWKAFDSAVLKAAQDRLIGIADLQARGLQYTIPNGLAKTVFAYQNASNLNDASVSMDGVNRGDRDRPKYSISYMPLPIFHKDFSFSVRNLEESRNGSMPLDTTSAELAARKVAEKMETYLFQGSGTYAFGAATTAIHGYMTETYRNTTSLTSNWDDSAATGETILADALAMKQALLDAKHYGPYVMYIPANFETAIDGEFKSNSDKTIRQRLLEISSVSDIRVADYLTDDNVIMVQMTQDVVRLINGMDIQVIQWDTEGGMQVNFKVMGIIVPQIRSDQDENSGVCHAS